MKVLFSIASVLALAAAPAFAGEGHVSSKSLTNCGLSGMKVMSDADGMQIRGLAAGVFGVEIANAGGGTVAINGYDSVGRHAAIGVAASLAVSTHGAAFAVGGAFSAVH